MPEDRVEAALAEQLAYYRLAAPAFDGHGTGAAIDEAIRRLRGAMDLSGDVLEIACGAGQWTARLAETARFVTALDAAPEMVAFTRRRLGDRSTGWVEVVCADVFAWRPGRRYRAVVFAFWLSHVPPVRFTAFWERVAECLAPGGMVGFVDDGPGDAAFEEDADADPAVPTVSRRVPEPGPDPGARYRVVKVLHDATELTRSLRALGWAAHVEPLPPSPDGRQGVYVGWARRA